MLRLINNPLPGQDTTQEILVRRRQTHRDIKSADVTSRIHLLEKVSSPHPLGSFPFLLRLCTVGLFDGTFEHRRVPGENEANCFLRTGLQRKVNGD